MVLCVERLTFAHSAVGASQGAPLSVCGLSVMYEKIGCKAVVPYLFLRFAYFHVDVSVYDCVHDFFVSCVGVFDYAFLCVGLSELYGYGYVFFGFIEDDCS